MSEPLAPFPDIQDVVVEMLGDLDGTAGTFVPADLTERLPFHLVYRFAGRDDRITDRPIVGIDTFAGTYAIGAPLAELVRQQLIAAPHVVTLPSGVVVVDTVTTSEGPHEVPYGDSAVRRWVSAYTLTLRR